MLDLPEGVTAWREKDVLHLEMTPPSPPPLTLSEGEQVWGDYLVRVWRSEKNTPPPDGEGLSKKGRFSDHILTLSDGGKMSEWTLRCPQRGDGLTLPGARGRRSVKRLLTERGMPPRREGQATEREPQDSQGAPVAEESWDDPDRDRPVES